MRPHAEAGNDTELRGVALSYAVRLHPSAAELPPAQWDRLAAGNAFASYGWLLTAERCCRAPLEPLYFTLSRNGDLVAGAACAVTPASAEVETLDSLIFGRLAGVARAAGSTFLPSLVCGPLLGYGWHVGVDASLPPNEAAVARLFLVEAMEAEARRRSLDLAFNLVLDCEPDLQALLAARGYRRCRNIPVAVLDIRWTSFDDYLAHLRPKTRRELRRQSRRHQALGNRVELLAGDAPEGRLLELVEGNSRRHSEAGFPLGAGFYRELKEHLGERAWIFASRRERALNGTVLLLVQDGCGYALAAGVDHSRGDDFTYFQVAYSAPIAAAIAAGVRRLYFGRGLYDVKLRRGCRLVDSWVYARASGRRRAVSSVWFPLASQWNRRKLPPRARRALLDADAVSPRQR